MSAWITAKINMVLYNIYVVVPFKRYVNLLMYVYTVLDYQMPDTIAM